MFLFPAFGHIYFSVNVSLLLKLLLMAMFSSSSFFFYFKQHSYFYVIASNLESIFYSIELDIDSSINQALYNQDCGSFFPFLK